MKAKKQAFFIKNPRVLTDLIGPHLLDDERAFSISKRIELRPIDYENFITDLRVEREYIENAANLNNEQSDAFKCVLISRSGNTDGVLVVPDKRGFVEFAAYLEEYMLSTPA